MALVVENGTGLAGAEAYVSVADAATYLAARGDTTWAAAATADKEAALRRATAAIDGRYGQQFPGTRLRNRLQALEWPRADADDVENYPIAADAVPVEVKNATCEAALVELGTPGAMMPTVQRDDLLKRVKAGSVEVEYMHNAPAKAVYPLVHAALSRVLRSGASRYSGRLVRG